MREDESIYQGFEYSGSQESTCPPHPLRTKRKIQGMSAILLPLCANGDVDWTGFRRHVEKTTSAGLTPAINMDTGYANLISEEIRLQALDEAKSVLDSAPFVAGVFVGDSPDSPFNADAYRSATEPIVKRGGIPIFFQSYGLVSQDDDAIAHSYTTLAKEVNQFLAFELGTMFAPFGRIYSLELYEHLLRIPECVGAKHSSLSRQCEWERLRIRDTVRPEFMVLTGNDLAIDMVMYGSDYLLGLSTFDPVAFALRDRYWQAGDARFYELNDWLQYLGMFVFRPPVPGYKHNAAQFLYQRGAIASSLTYPGSAQRPSSDEEVLRQISSRLRQFVEEAN